MGYGVGTKSVAGPKEGTKIFSSRVILKIYELNFELMHVHCTVKLQTLDCTTNIFKVIFTVFNCVRLSTVVLLYGLHLIAAPSTIK